MMTDEDSSPDDKRMSPTESDICMSSGGDGQFKGRFKLCTVCGDRALSCNFGAITCESCKAFFRRHATKEIWGQCDGTCPITIETRSYCRRCRLFKCFSVGMRKDLILTDEQREKRRKKIEDNRKRRQSAASNPDMSSDALLTDVFSSTPPPDQHGSQPPPIGDEYYCPGITSSSDGYPPPGAVGGMMMSPQMGFMNPPKGSYSDDCEDNYGPKVQAIDTQSERDFNMARGEVHGPPYSDHSSCTSSNGNSPEGDLFIAGHCPSQVSPLDGDGAVRRSLQDLSMNASPPGGAAPYDIRGPRSRENSFSDVPQGAPAEHGTYADHAQQRLYQGPHQAAAGTDTHMPHADHPPMQLTSPHEQQEQPPKLPVPPGREMNIDEYAHSLRPVVAPDRLVLMTKDASAAVLTILNAYEAFCHPVPPHFHSKEIHLPYMDLVNSGEHVYRNLVGFCKRLPEFRSLSQEDQIMLLKGNVLQVLIMRYMKTYDPSRQAWVVKNQGTQRAYKPEDMSPSAGTNWKMEDYQRFVQGALKVTEGDNMVIVMLLVLGLFTAQYTEVQEAQVVEHAQARYKMALKEFLEVHYPERKDMFAQCLSVLSSVQRMGRMAMEAMSTSTVQDLHPLVVEMFDLV